MAQALPVAISSRLSGCVCIIIVAVIVFFFAPHSNRSCAIQTANLMMQVLMLCLFPLTAHTVQAAEFTKSRESSISSRPTLISALKCRNVLARQ